MEIPFSPCLLQGYFWKRQEPGEDFGSIPSLEQLYQSSGGAAKRMKWEKCSFSAKPSLAGACAGRSCSQRSPSRPLAFASSSAKACLDQPLNICRAAPLLPLTCCSHRASHPSPGWFFPATSSSFKQPCRASPFPHPPAAGRSESWRGCSLNLLIHLQNQDLGDTMLRVLFYSSRHLPGRGGIS